MQGLIRIADVVIAAAGDPWLPDGTGMSIGIALLLAAYFIGLPLLLIPTIKMDADPVVAEFDPEATPPPGSVAGYFADAARGLNNAGFRHHSSLLLPAPVHNVRAILQLWVNATTRDVALISVVYALIAGSDEVLQTKHIEFMSEFDDHRIRSILTGNNDDPGSFPLPDTNLVFRLPQVEDPEKLYFCHKALVDRHAPSARQVLRVSDQYENDAPRYLKEHVLQKEYRRNGEIGYLRLDAACNCWRPTPWGGLRMVWKELWPMKQIRTALVRTRGLRLERELAV